MSVHSKKILFLMSGSIACAKATGLLSRLKQDQHEIQVACTPETFQFIGSATIEGLIGVRPYSSVFENDRMMSHIDLARWADLVVIAPATANLINKMSVGIGDDIVQTLMLAIEPSKPVVLFPAMNTQMWLHPTVQESCNKLVARGIDIAPTDDGNLACGEVGPGRLLEVDKAFAYLDKYLENVKKPTVAKKRILISGGGTEEPIDQVRSLGNFSTGQTAQTLAAYLANQGHDVTLLLAAKSKERNLKSIQSVKRFKTADDLENLFKQELSKTHFDTVIHAAAVSDFKVNVVGEKEAKLDSDKSWQLELVPRKKILSQLREFSLNKEMRLISFKLTQQKTEEEAKELSQKYFNSGSDYVIWNDLSNVQDEKHNFSLMNKELILKRGQSKADLCLAIEEVL